MGTTKLAVTVLVSFMFLIGQATDVTLVKSARRSTNGRSVFSDYGFKVRCLNNRACLINPPSGSKIKVSDLLPALRSALKEKAA